MNPIEPPKTGAHVPPTKSTKEPNKIEGKVDASASAALKKQASGTEPLSLKPMTEKKALDLVKEEIVHPEKHEKYDRQVILNLGRGVSAAKLCNKAELQGLPSTVVSFTDSNPDLAPLNELTLDSRIYIIGHGLPGAISVWSKEGVKGLTVSQYVNLLKSNPKLQDDGSGRRIKISVVACYGGTDALENKSFAESLSVALFNAGIAAEVIGRKSVTAVTSAEPGIIKPGEGPKTSETAYKVVNERWQESAMKVSYITTKEGTQIKDVRYSNPTETDQYKFPEGLNPEIYNHSQISSEEEDYLLIKPGQWLFKTLNKHYTSAKNRMTYNITALSYVEESGKKIITEQIRGNLNKSVMEHYLRKYGLDIANGVTAPVIPDLKQKVYTIPREGAEFLLNLAPDTWLLRHSQNTRGIVISYHHTNGELRHMSLSSQPLGQKSLDSILHKLGLNPDKMIVPS